MLEAFIKITMHLLSKLLKYVVKSYFESINTLPFNRLINIADAFVQEMDV